MSPWSANIASTPQHGRRRAVEPDNQAGASAVREEETAIAQACQQCGDQLRIAPPLACSAWCAFAELIDKLEDNSDQSFYLFKILRAHILPLTNCAFNKSGDR